MTRTQTITHLAVKAVALALSLAAILAVFASALILSTYLVFNYIAPAIYTILDAWLALPLWDVILG